MVGSLFGWPACLLTIIKQHKFMDLQIEEW